MTGVRVILEVDAIRSPLTGIGRYAYELLRGLRHHPRVSSVRLIANGQWVEIPANCAFPVAPTSSDAVSTSRSRLDGAKIYLAGAPAFMVPYRQVKSALAWRRLRGFADHVYHSPNYFLPPFAGSSVATIHDLSAVRYPGIHPAERVALFDIELPKTLARAQHLITDSEAIRREVIEHFHWPEERITAIPLGVDASFHPRESSELVTCLNSHRLTPDGYCLCVATIEPRKNIARLLDAHAALPSRLRQRFPLVLVGERGWNSERIHERIRAAQFNGSVRYLDYVAQSDLPCLFAAARLFIFPSLYEGFGLPPLEAMASGVPVVTSTCPALCELTQGIGLQVDPEDTDALSQAIQRGLEDDAWRCQSRALGLRRADEFTWGRCVEQTLALYARLLV